MDVAHEAAEQKLCNDLMNRDAEIRIAMCELCGFTVDDVERDDDNVVKRIWVSYPAAWTATATQPWPPDFLKDLNAVHAAEKFLPHGKRKLYEQCLDLFAAGVFSDAEQRCEALLRTMKQWNTKWDIL